MLAIEDVANAENMTILLGNGQTSRLQPELRTIPAGAYDSSQKVAERGRSALTACEGQVTGKALAVGRGSL
jgi:hypothetical protein